MVLFLTWWYGEKFRNILEYFGVFLVYLFDLFSVRICLTTLFSVWRRDRVNYKGLALTEIFQAWSLNIASRIVGFFVKIATILVYILVSIALIVLAIVFLGLWLLFPLVIIGLIYLGFKIMAGL